MKEQKLLINLEIDANEGPLYTDNTIRAVRTQLGTDEPLIWCYNPYKDNRATEQLLFFGTEGELLKSLCVYIANNDVCEVVGDIPMDTSYMITRILSVFGIDAEFVCLLELCKYIVIYSAWIDYD